MNSRTHSAVHTLDKPVRESDMSGITFCSSTTSEQTGRYSYERAHIRRFSSLLFCLRCWRRRSEPRSYGKTSLDAGVYQAEARKVWTNTWLFGRPLDARPERGQASGCGLELPPHL